MPSQPPTAHLKTADQGTPAPIDLPEWPHIPGYKLQREIGRGGMGVVYQAVHTKLGRPVAVKVAAGVILGPERLARFETEAKSAAAVEHTNVIRVYEYGDYGGRPYLVLEMADGGSLQDRLDRGRLPPGEAVELVAAIARGVAAVHAKGILHRDLKPANVLFAGRVPKVADFGLARGPEAADLTAPGVVVGTRGYMAPEQAAGDNHLVGPPADVYALGAILTACLTGRPHLAADPTGMPKEVVSVVRRALDPDPDCRFRSVDDFAGVLVEAWATAVRHKVRQRTRVATVLGVGALAAVATSGIRHNAVGIVHVDPETGVQVVVTPGEPVDPEEDLPPASDPNTASAPSNP